MSEQLLGEHLTTIPKAPLTQEELQHRDQQRQIKVDIHDEMQKHTPVRRRIFGGVNRSEVLEYPAIQETARPISKHRKMVAWLERDSDGEEVRLVTQVVARAQKNAYKREKPQIRLRTNEDEITFEDLFPGANRIDEYTSEQFDDAAPRILGTVKAIGELATGTARNTKQRTPKRRRGKGGSVSMSEHSEPEHDIEDAVVVDDRTPTESEQHYETTQPQAFFERRDTEDPDETPDPNLHRDE